MSRLSTMDWISARRSSLLRNGCRTRGWAHRRLRFALATPDSVVDGKVSYAANARNINEFSRLGKTPRQNREVAAVPAARFDPFRGATRRGQAPSVTTP